MRWFQIFAMLLSMLLAGNAAGGQWSWIGGTQSLGEEVVYGTQGIPDEANTPGKRLDALTWSGADGRLYLYGGASSADDLWGYDPSTRLWTWLKGTTQTLNKAMVFGERGMPDPANTPGLRSGGAATWAGRDGRLYLFGGVGYVLVGDNVMQRLCDDLWRYDPETNQWTWLKGTINGQYSFQPVYGRQGVFDLGHTPGSRLNAAFWTGADGMLYLYGGYAGSSTAYFSDIWRYDPSSNQWSWVGGTQTRADPPVYGIRGVADPANTPGGARTPYVTWPGVNGRFYMLCPSTDSTYFHSDFWCYEEANNLWTWLGQTPQYGSYGTRGVAAEDTMPAHRSYPYTWSGLDGKLYLYGGGGHAAAGSGDLSDLWRYDPDPGQWTWLQGSNMAGEAAVYGTYGIGDPANTPGARARGQGWRGGDGTFYLFGAYDHELTDLWSFTPPFSASGDWMQYP